MRISQVNILKFPFRSKMETWIEWGWFPGALKTPEPSIILSFILIRNFVSDPRKAILQNWCVCSQMNFWWWWINIFWKHPVTSTHSEWCGCFLIRTSILQGLCLWYTGQHFVLIIHSLTDLIHSFLILFQNGKKKKSGDVLNFCTF